MTTLLVGLDWGTTHLRAYRYGDAGAVLESRALSFGIRQLPSGGFAQAFEEATTGWPDAPVIACGMVGSRNGWRETPYLDTPADVSRLAHALTPLPLADGRTLHLVSGLRDPERPDVMRGEETQIVGVLAQHADMPWSGTLLLPGTHSKWVRITEGVVTGFATMMTGELYGLLSRHSILGGASADAAHDDAAFLRGVHAARDSGAAGGLSSLFSARALMLDGALTADAVPSYLSGLLIGDELRAAIAAGWADAALPVQMVGSAALCPRYADAAGVFGLRLRQAPENTTAHGLWQVATAAGLIDHASARVPTP